MSTDPKQDLAEAFAVGTPVLAWTGTRDDAPRWTKTRSEPWQLGGGHWVVSVEGIAGGIALSHIERIPDGWMSPEDRQAEIETTNAALRIHADHGAALLERAEKAEHTIAAVRKEVANPDNDRRMSLLIIGALVDPDPIEGVWDGTTYDEDGPSQPLSVLCNSCGRALANVGEWCCNRYTTTADVTTVERDHVAEAAEVRKQRKG